MSDFEFIFALFGLLLGLSLAEILAGLARTIETRLHRAAAKRIGWLTPLLAAFVLLDLLSFWQSAWLVRDMMSVSRHTLFAVTIFASAYYLAAHLVVPRAIGENFDFDEHFFRVRRVVIGILLGLLFWQLAWFATIPALQPRLTNTPSIVATTVLVVLMVAALLVRDRRWCAVVMAALVGRYLSIYLVALA